MANFEVFCWNFSSSTNSEFGRGDYTSNKLDATLAQAVEWVSKRDILLVKGEKSTFPRLFFSNSRFETLLKVPRQSTMVTELGKYNE